MAPRVQKAPVGSYERDIADGEYTLKWNSLGEMEFWLRNEERRYTIEFVTYPDTTMILGLYVPEHSHPTGDDNVRYTRIPLQARAEIENLLREGMRPDLILNKVRGNVHTEDQLAALEEQPARREEFINSRDVHRIEKKIAAETVRLHQSDGLS
ncbi:hypothetical protein B0H19DRAFT_920796, partial [Mycena capillaripes]